MKLDVSRAVRLRLALGALALGVGACSGGKSDALSPPPGGHAGDGGATTTAPGEGNDGGTVAASEAGATSPGPVLGSTTSCVYTEDTSFCACLGDFNCGGVTIADGKETYHSVYCGACPGAAFCRTTATDVFIGRCGGANPLVYEWQREKRDMLVAMGENDDTGLNYDYCQNIDDGRGYTIGKVGFCTGTGDFVIVAACYNDLKPGNALAKYWPALTQYADAYITQNANQGDTAAIDTIGGSATQFCADVAAVAADPVFTGCQDAIADADYMSPAAAHAQAMHLSGALTIGFLYDTELNFGEDDDPPTKSGKPGTPGALTMIARANADYGTGMPTDFTGKTWEESRWLGYLIKERALAMSNDRTWSRDMDQDATWEAARRQHTTATNSPESSTDLTMSYDIVSAYKAGAPTPAPCWGDPPLASAYDTQSSIYSVSLDKSASATDQTKWRAVGTLLASGTYEACPANPTP